MLREYRREDLDPMRAFVNDPETTKNLTDIFLRPHTRENTESFLESVLTNESSDKILFVVADRETEAYLGQIDLRVGEPSSRVAELGLVIADPEQRGRGVGKEAVSLLLDYAFNRMNLHKVELSVYSFNVAGYRCYEKCGFREEGRMRENVFRDGSYYDTIRMGILRREFAR
jgi:RimJ/RimL family protein N-acetyltransferase